jgi:signal transduction histidine kinase
MDTRDAELTVESERTVAADRSRLRQLLSNLFRNAVEHGGHGPAVTVGDFDSGFFVADDGPGVPPRERDAVFEWGRSEDETGTGIGLPLVREIARGHGWTVSLVASDTDGARFEFETDW